MDLHQFISGLVDRCEHLDYTIKNGIIKADLFYIDYQEKELFNFIKRHTGHESGINFTRPKGNSYTYSFSFKRRSLK